MNDMLQLLPVTVFLAFAIPLSLIDTRRHILPNRLVFASLLCTVVSEGLLVVHGTSFDMFTQSLMIAIKTLCVYTCLVVASRDGRCEVLDCHWTHSWMGMS